MRIIGWWTCSWFALARTFVSSPSVEMEPFFNRFPLIILRKQHEVFAIGETDRRWYRHGFSPRRRAAGTGPMRRSLTAKERRIQCEGNSQQCR